MIAKSSGVSSLDKITVDSNVMPVDQNCDTPFHMTAVRKRMKKSDVSPYTNIIIVR